MIFPVALLAAFILFPATLGSEECHEKDAQLLKCQTDLHNDGLEKYAQILKCQQDYSHLVKSNLEMQNKYTEVISQLMDEKVKYAQLQSKHQEVDNLKDLINQKNKEIDLLKVQIKELKEKSELATLTKQIRKDIAKLGKIVKIGGINKNNSTKSNNTTKKVEVETEEVPKTPLPNNINQTTSTETIDFPDPCQRSQKVFAVFRQIQLPGSDSFDVICVSDSELGSGWFIVYAKRYNSNILNRTYEDYERGFMGEGTPLNQDYFIGLKILHTLTNGKPYEVLFKTIDSSKRCNKFVVGDRSEAYKMKSIGNCTGDALWMIPKQGSKFSTYDRDEDGVPDRHLAKEEGFGWWFDPGMSPKIDDFFMFIRRTY